MSATKVPSTSGLPTLPQVTRKSYTPGIGYTEDQEWSGEYSEIESKYNGLVGQAEIGGIPGNNIRSVTFENTNGRSRVIASFARQQTVAAAGLPSDVAVVEELYAVDIVRDVTAAPYFVSAVGTAVTDDQAAIVIKAAELKLIEADITAKSCGLAWGSWTAGMKQLRYHMLHGQESYYETGFILRRSIHGMITSQVRQSFTGINTVVTAPTFKSPMDKLIEALPTGEWLYKPPQAEYMGDGKWRITQEWHWAEKWSKMYGGTWGL